MLDFLPVPPSSNFTDIPSFFVQCYVACGAKLVLLDFGAATGNGTPRITGEWTFNDDDINCLALSEDNQFLAAADDTGEIKLIHLKPQVKVLMNTITVIMPSLMWGITCWVGKPGMFKRSKYYLMKFSSLFMKGASHIA